MNSGVSFALKSEGNVSFDRSVNPQDFLDTKVSFHYFRSQGGAITVTDEMATRLNELETELVMIGDQDSLDNSAAWKEFAATVSRNLTTQIYIDFSIVAGIESNQDFSLKQLIYGVQVGADLKAWNQNSTLAIINIFDWPFAVIRVLTGLDDDLSPRGSTIPTVLVGIDQVVPEDDPMRAALGEDSNYPRFRGEVAFRTRVSESADFMWGLRYYRELGASDEIKSANIGEFFFVSSALTLSKGMYVRYTTGQLPFDATDDQVYELGFRYKFD